VVVFELGTAGEHPVFAMHPEVIGEWDVEHLPPSVQVIWDEAVTAGSEQIAASVTVTFAIR
jgi:hypothetical protein